VHLQKSELIVDKPHSFIHSSLFGQKFRQTQRKAKEQSWPKWQVTDRKICGEVQEFRAVR